jgi:hypothetical protein
VANQVHSFLQRGLGPEYIDEYPKHLQAVTSKQVNRTIKQHLRPELTTLVIAGSLDKPEEIEPVTIQEKQNLSVRLDTPDAGWAIEIEKVYRTSDSLVVISQLQHSGDMAAQVISTVSDSVNIPAIDDELPVRHYVLGKIWKWGDSPNYSFIESMDAFGTALDGAELLYQVK